MKPKDLILSVLCVEQKKRSTRNGFVIDPVDGFSVPEWVIWEREAVLAAVNEIRVNAKLSPIDSVTLVKKAEWEASGHCDYTSKYALYAAELTRALPTDLTARAVGCTKLEYE